MPPGFRVLIAAQLASSLADNALLIVAIALLHEQAAAAWIAPLLKFGFTMAYVVLAPFVGALADAFVKARLMAWMNGMKIAGACSLLAGVDPLMAFAIVGIGAAGYAPAKYGLVTELVPAPRLVAANGWIEISVVFAILAGTLLGGLLVSDSVTGSAAARSLGSLLGSPSAYAPSLLVLLAVYGCAALLNLGIPDSGARYTRGVVHPWALLRDFAQANRTLWRDPEGGLSLAVTTLFWGVGATLQFIVLKWAVDRLGLSLERAAYLQAVVAIGVVIGAAGAGRWVPMGSVKQVLPVGVAFGLMVPLLALLPGPWAAVPVLIAAGAAGGLLLVPMNALLQQRGCTLLSAGRSIAVQGYNENSSVLCMLAAYAALLALDVGIVTLMWGLGLGVAAGTLALMQRERQRGLRVAASDAA